MVKYQIFVSSTFEDLKEERSQVIRAILEMGHIPVGMEMFSAADEEQWKIIARQIDESDYYVVIVGHRYGSVTGGVSYTEKEYDYAVGRNVPVLGFIVDSSVEPLAKNVEKEADKIAALSSFQLKVKDRPVGFWRTADDLHGKVSIALMKAFHTNPRPGWTRTTGNVGPEVTQELSRLSRENADLREQLNSEKRTEESDRRKHLQSRIDTLKAVTTTLYLREEGAKTWDIEVKTNLFKIFKDLAPEMMVEISVEGASSYLGLVNKKSPAVKLTSKAPVPYNFVRDLLADLASLGLVEPSKKKHPVADKTSYWSLSDEGMEVLKLYRVTGLEARAAATRSAGVKEISPAKKARNQSAE